LRLVISGPCAATASAASSVGFTPSGTERLVRSGRYVATVSLGDWRSPLATGRYVVTVVAAIAAAAAGGVSSLSPQSLPPAEGGGEGGGEPGGAGRSAGSLVTWLGVRGQC